MRVVITGIGDFIGRNLADDLDTRPEIDVYGLEADASETDVARALQGADVICHLASVSRSDDVSAFDRVNARFTEAVCAAARRAGSRAPILYESSTHVDRPTPYGVSKRAAEDALLAHARETGARVHIFRLPNVIGRWARPNYNSAVATFCHNIARDLPIRIDSPDAPLTLVHVDDVVEAFVRVIDGRSTDGPFCVAGPEYPTTVGEVAAMLRSFRDAATPPVQGVAESGLAQALYATYVSYVPQ